ncbi:MULTISPECIES: hypothetical protein [unclassified Amycolatopsis]|uniref:hypothetical protein n=1 Tax=unclassified Amycolatopsis TaxID=2618356 RepID=UPI001FF5B8F9|nr:hypothetical protein [Amycolatopsis sp. FBCC-B4732]UOX90199.1 hypothetical protein MUY14_06105 [Amycolatopsis sp. FBCC-B4732]
MKEFESALAAGFDVVPAEVPGLAIDRLDGGQSTGSPARLCYTWVADPVRPSVSPCR